MTNSTEIKRYISTEYPDYELLRDMAVSIDQQSWLKCMPKTLMVNNQLNIPLVISLSIAEIIEHGKNEIERTRVEHPWVFTVLQDKSRETYEMVYSYEESKPEYTEEKVFEVSFLISMYGVLLDHNL